MFYPHPPGTLHVNPSNPTAIASASYLMNGLGVAGASAWVITPTVSGRILLLATGQQTASTTALTCTHQLSYGTSTAPANAAAPAGTQFGQQVAWVSLTGILTVPFTLAAVVSGLTVGTAYWLDIASKASSGTVQLTNLACIVIEL